MVTPESSTDVVIAKPKYQQLSSRPALPVVSKGKKPVRFSGYEADKSLAKILELSSRPLTASSLHGRPVTTSTLLGKDANHRGITFTAKMQPKIEPGQAVELFFDCRSASFVHSHAGFDFSMVSTVPNVRRKTRAASVH